MLEIGNPTPNQSNKQHVVPTILAHDADVHPVPDLDIAVGVVLPVQLGQQPVCKHFIVVSSCRRRRRRFAAVLSSIMRSYI